MNSVQTMDTLSGPIRSGPPLNHHCFRCDKRFPNSGLLAKHLHDEHEAFVERGVPRAGLEAQPIVINNEKTNSHLSDNESYKNHIARCPYCNEDCQTRKKLMRHLELEHKEESDHDQHDEPQVKFIRVHAENNDHLMQKLGKVNGMPSNNNAMLATLKGNPYPEMTNNSSTPKPMKTESPSSKIKTAAKFQYKCFWCEASFRKRGKLMDHIDSLHKQSKQQNQAEAEMLCSEDSGKRSSFGSTSRQMQSPPYESSSQIGFTQQRETSNSICSFKHVGSVSNPKVKIKEEPEKDSICKFYFTKKENPLLHKQTQKTGMFDYANNAMRVPVSGMNLDSFMNFNSSGMISPMEALQRNYMQFGLRPPMMSMPGNFYGNPRMPMMIPNLPSDLMLNRRQLMGDSLSNQQTSPHSQFMARFNAFSAMNPRMPYSPSDSPLNLTKH